MMQMYYFYEKTPLAYREGESLLLFTQLPRRGVPGNPYAARRIVMRLTRGKGRCTP